MIKDIQKKIEYRARLLFQIDDLSKLVGEAEDYIKTKMLAEGFPKIELEDGTVAELVDQTSVEVKDQEAFYGWLKEAGEASLIKRVVQIIYTGFGGLGSTAFSLVAADVGREHTWRIGFIGDQPLDPSYSLRCAEHGVA